ncbi:MAG: M23 family metallopeptidase [Alphaproteobacteria bacterium]
MFFRTLLLLCLTLPAHALEVGGRLAQGGFILGTAQAGSTVTVNGKKATMAPDGTFVFGLERHFPTSAVVVEIPKAGKKLAQEVVIEPREWVVEKVIITNTKAKQTINPNTKQTNRAAEEQKAIDEARRTLTYAPHFLGCCQYPLRKADHKWRISGVFGSSRQFNGQERSWHKGLDLAVPTGTPVYPVASGTVVFAADTFFSGNLVLIDHGLGILSAYAHLNKMHVKVGQKLNTDNSLGQVGQTGRASGPHLHWAMYWRQTPIDPILWVEEGT